MVQKKLREKAKELLSKKEVDLIIGFGEGTQPLRATPIFIRTPEEADRLVWNSFCENNLATYLHKFNRFKVGIVVKGCDARSVTALALEKRFKPEQVVLIIVSGENGEIVLKRDAYLYPLCKACTHRNPIQETLLVGDCVEEVSLTEPNPEAKEFEKKPPEERWAFFEKETGRCIRCYACREACPMCYCTECFVDSSNPKWIEKSLSPSDLQFYHIVRSYHQTGRCTNCGACERACPMDIRLTYLTQKLNQEVEELFQFETGVDPKALPPLSTFKTDDPQEFIK
jgi:formate dehydrogenase subunit beta